MSRWVKKIEKNCADSLRPSERVVAATFGQPPGSLLMQMIPGGVAAVIALTILNDSLGAALAGGLGGGFGGLIGAVAVALRNKLRAGTKAENETGETPLVAPLVSKGRVMPAITNERMLFFGLGSFTGTPKKLLLELDLSESPRVNLSAGNKLLRSMSFVFADHSTMKMEVAKAAKPEIFVKAAQKTSSEGGPGSL